MSDYADDNTPLWDEALASSFCPNCGHTDDSHLSFGGVVHEYEGDIYEGRELYVPVECENCGTEFSYPPKDEK